MQRTNVRREPTANVVVSAVHHISSVDELVARAFHTQFGLRVTQNDLPPGETAKQSHVSAAGGCVQLLSMPTNLSLSAQELKKPYLNTIWLHFTFYSISVFLSFQTVLGYQGLFEYSVIKSKSEISDLKFCRTCCRRLWVWSPACV